MRPALRERVSSGVKYTSGVNEYWRERKKELIGEGMRVLRESAGTGKVGDYCLWRPP